MPLSESEAKLLLALLRNDRTPIMSLPKKADLGGSAVYNSVEKLLERGLVNQIREKEPPRRRIISLTEDGIKIARLLQEIEQQL